MAEAWMEPDRAGRRDSVNADKHSPASSARSDCVHEQVAKRIANVRFTEKPAGRIGTSICLQVFSINSVAAHSLSGIRLLHWTSGEGRSG